MINLRDALMTGKRTPTAKDYVQSGLVAMWDGIENDGFGRHDSTKTTWKDLSGNGNDLAVRLASLWGANNLYCDGDAWSAYRAGRINYQSIECVYQTVSFKTIKGNANGTRTLFYGAGSFRLLNTPELRTNQSSEDSIPRASVELYSVNSRRVVAIATANDGAMHQICGIYNDATTGLPEEGFFNGQKSETTTTWNWGTASNTVIGDRQIDAQAWPWNGMVFAIRLYSRALTAEEIAHNYNIDKARFVLP